MLHELLRSKFPRLSGQLAQHTDDPYLVEHVLPPATESDLEALESRLGHALPETYKSLIRLTRGFWLSGGVIRLSNMHPFFHDFPPLDKLAPPRQRAVRQRGAGWPPPSQGMLCFAEYFWHADGDQVLWDVGQGLVNGEYPVMYYAHEARKPSVTRVAPEFGEWLEHCLDPFLEGRYAE